jgi:hypothetical protein
MIGDRRIGYCVRAVFTTCVLMTGAIAAGEVRIQSGALEGVKEPDSEVRAFTGIPFAAPPVGALRWKGPQPSANWTGVRKADQFGPRCMHHEASGGVLWCWADYYHRRTFVQYAVFGPYGVVTVDRRPKLALRALAKMYGGKVTEPPAAK